MSFRVTTDIFCDKCSDRTHGTSSNRIEVTASRKLAREIIEAALENYAQVQVDLVVQGLYLSPADRNAWLRENEWSGL